MTDKTTSERILDAAERLFAERGGEDGASMRDLAAAAGVRLSQLSYYFGSKDALYRAVFARRGHKLARAREEALAEVMRCVAPTTEDIIAALITPSVHQRFMEGVQGEAFALLTAQEAVDPREAARGVLAEHFDPTAKLFMAALSRLYPKAKPYPITAAYLFTAGALAMTMADRGRLSRLSMNEISSSSAPHSADTLVDQLTAFCAAGVDAILNRQYDGIGKAVRQKTNSTESGTKPTVIGRPPRRRNAA